MLEPVRLTHLKRIPVEGGDVLHAMKASDLGYGGFGEAYFSLVAKGVVKGWKRHRRMTLNLIVPFGCIQFSIIDEMANLRQDYCLSPELEQNYRRLTIPPGYWVAFGGISPHSNILLNIANIEHVPDEADKKPLDAFDWVWKTP